LAEKWGTAETLKEFRMGSGKMAKAWLLAKKIRDLITCKYF